MLYIYIRNVSWTVNLSIREKNIISKKWLATFFLLVCILQFWRLCLSRMSTINEPSYFLRERATYQPEIRLTANGDALSPIQPLYSMTTHIANRLSLATTRPLSRSILHMAIFRVKLNRDYFCFLHLQWFRDKPYTTTLNRYEHI